MLLFESAMNLTQQSLLHRPTTELRNLVLSLVQAGKRVLRQDPDAFAQRLDQVDWGPIAFKLMHPDDGKGLSRAEALARINRYRQFLYLHHIYPNAQLVPDRHIDHVWHCHILDTEKYRQDCQLLFGRFLDHFPYFGMRGEEDFNQLGDAFAETRQLLERHFASPLPDSSAITTEVREVSQTLQ